MAALDRRFSTLFTSQGKSGPLSQKPSTSTAATQDVSSTIGLPPPLKGKRSTKRSLKRRLLRFLPEFFDPFYYPAPTTKPTITQEIVNQVWDERAEPTATPRPVTAYSCTITGGEPLKPSRTSHSKRPGTAHPPTTFTKSPKRGGGKNEREVIVRSPPHEPFPSFSRASIFGKAGSNSGKDNFNAVPPARRRADSKFGSLSSLPSISTLTKQSSSRSSSATRSTPTSITLSRDQFALLQSRLRRLSRRLAQHEYIASHLSNNLLFILVKKEMWVRSNPRYKMEEKRAVSRDIFNTKEGVGRVFMRKTLCSRRSTDVLGKLERVVRDAAARSSIGSRKSGEYKEGEEEKDKEDDKHKQIAEDDAQGDYKIHADEIMVDLLRSLKQDMAIQKELDDDIKLLVWRLADSKKWKGDAVTMFLHRFERFTDQRLECLVRCYKQLDGLVKELEGLLAVTAE